MSYPFDEAKAQTIETSKDLQVLLATCLAMGMKDHGSRFHNSIIGFLEDFREISTENELREILLKAKTVEKDLSAWLSMQGKTTVSLNWPSPPPLELESDQI